MCGEGNPIRIQEGEDIFSRMLISNPNVQTQPPFEMRSAVFFTAAAAGCSIAAALAARFLWSKKTHASGASLPAASEVGVSHLQEPAPEPTSPLVEDVSLKYEANVLDISVELETHEGYQTELKVQEVSLESFHGAGESHAEKEDGDFNESSVLQQSETDLQNQNGDMSRKLEEATDEMLSLGKEFEEVEEETSGRIQTMKVHTDDLQMEIDSLHIQISEQEENIKLLRRRSSEDQVLMTNLEDELTGKVSIQESLLSENENRFNELLTNHRQLESQFKQSCAKLEVAEREIAEMGIKEETIRTLEIVQEEQKKETSKLKETQTQLLEKLKTSDTEKADFEKEVFKLYGQVQTYEVLLLLSNQKLESQFMESCGKLEVAEREIAKMGIKEENIRTLEIFQEEQKKETSKLKETQTKLLEKLKTFDTEKADYEKEVFKLFGQVQTYELQLLLSNQKLKIIETETKETVDNCKRLEEEMRKERRELEEQITSLSEKRNRLKDELRRVKEAAQLLMTTSADELRELGSTTEENNEDFLKRLSEYAAEIKIVKAYLVEQFAEKQKLKNEMRELEKRLKLKEGILEKNLTKMVELEKRLQVKEEEVLAKEEEKREAIRQLCLLIEYHRENCNHLYKYIAATAKKSG